MAENGKEPSKTKWQADDAGAIKSTESMKAETSKQPNPQELTDSRENTQFPFHHQLCWHLLPLQIRKLRLEKYSKYSLATWIIRYRMVSRHCTYSTKA